MPYSKTTWKDRLVEFANRFTKSNETATSVTLTADPGVVTEAGTPLSAANLNKIEQGIADAAATADAALPKAGGTMTGNTVHENTFGQKGKKATGGTEIFVSRVSGDNVFIGDSSAETHINGTNIRYYDGASLQQIWHSGNDGSGSGLDADTVDGVDSGGIVWGFSPSATNLATNFNTITKSGFYAGESATGAPDSDWYFVLHHQYPNNNGWAWQQIQSFYFPNKRYERTKNSGTWSAWKAVGGVKSVQRGVASLGPGPLDVTINAVDMNKAFVNFPNSANASSNAQNARVQLINSTTLRFWGFSGLGVFDYTWEVIEYN